MDEFSSIISLLDILAHFKLGSKSHVFSFSRITDKGQTMLNDFDHQMYDADGEPRWIKNSDVSPDGDILTYTEVKKDDKGKETIGKTYKSRNGDLKSIRMNVNPYGKIRTNVRITFDTNKFNELMADTKMYSYTELSKHYKTATIC